MKYFVKKGHFTRLSLVLFVGSIAFLCYSSIYTVAIFSRDNILGLAEKLNPFYWVGLSLILLSLLLMVFDSNINNARQEKLFLLEVCLLVQYLYAISALVLTNVPYYDAWAHTSSSMSILISGNYDHSFDSYARQFPGAFIIQSTIFLVTAMDPILLIKFHNIISSLLMVLISYLLLRKLLIDRRMVYIGTIFLVTGSVWVFSQNFAPSSFGLIWYLFLFYFAFSKRDVKTICLSTLLTITTVVSHPTTLPFLVASATFTFVWLSFFSKRNLIKSYRKQYWLFPVTSVVFIVVAWLAWLMFTAPAVLSNLVLVAVNFFKNLVFERVTERFQTTPHHITGQTLKIIYSLAYLIVGIIGTSLLTFKIFKKKERKNVFLFVMTISWLTACVILGVMTTFLHGGQFYERTLLYGFIPLTILAMFAYNNRYGKLLLLCVILAGAPLSVFAEYSNIYFDYCPVSDSYGSIFLVSHNVTNLGAIKTALPTRFVYRFYLYYRYFQNGLTFEHPLKEENMAFIWSRVSENYYLVYVKESGYSQLAYEKLMTSWLENFETFAIQPNSTMVYDNGDFRAIFMRDIRIKR
jgi:hypothetical protein